MIIVSIQIYTALTYYDFMCDGVPSSMKCT